MTVPEKPDLRIYGPADFPSVLGLIGNAFGGESQESVRFAVSASNTTTFVAEIARSVVGVAMAIAFGQTAWLGNVVVSPAWRRRGLGRTLTERALQHALEEADTVLLLALGEAQRIYERLGFAADGLYGTWTRQDQPAAARESCPGRCPACRNRRGAFRSLRWPSSACHSTGPPPARIAAPTWSTSCLSRASPTRIAPESEKGWRPATASRLSWGTGAIIAEDPQAAAGLVGDLLAAFPQTRLEFPDANEAGCRLASELGLVRVKENLRMRFGPPVAGFRPQHIYKALTPAVG